MLNTIVDAQKRQCSVLPCQLPERKRRVCEGSEKRAYLPLMHNVETNSMLWENFSRLHRQWEKKIEGGVRRSADMLRPAKVGGLLSSDSSRLGNIKFL